MPFRKFVPESKKKNKPNPNFAGSGWQDGVSVGRGGGGGGGRHLVEVGGELYQF